MPTLEFLDSLSEAKELPPIELYGFRPHVFEELDDLMWELVMEDDELDPTDSDQIKSQLLRVGPCPSTSRVYYTIASQPDLPGSEEPIDTIVGYDLEEEKPRRKVGIDFEDWIDDANKAVNEWLRTGETTALEELDIPQRIINFYIDRLASIGEEAADLDLDLEDLEMTIQEDFSARFFHEASPDGAWLINRLEGFPGGVFESKLRPLPHPVDKHALTGYAVYLERARELPVDVGVYLHLDPDLEEIVVDSFVINDNFRDQIRMNVTRLATLILQSKEADRWDEGGPIKDRLIEPKEPEYVSHCENCPYAGECHRER